MFSKKIINSVCPLLLNLHTMEKPGCAESFNDLCRNSSIMCMSYWPKEGVIDNSLRYYGKLDHLI